MSDQGHRPHADPGLRDGLKPMNCPAHCLVFKHAARSYRELPVRLAEFTALHRNESSGALTGLTRVRQFHQDDGACKVPLRPVVVESPDVAAASQGHIFCSEEQIEGEVRATLDMMDRVYSRFGFDYALRLSTRPDKSVGGDEAWNHAEARLQDALEGFGRPWTVNPGDGAFYGSCACATRPCCAACSPAHPLRQA